MTQSATGPMMSSPQADTVVGRFRAMASRCGDRLAVHGPSGARTYRDLDDVSDALAARIRSRADGGERVALLCGHDVDLLPAVLAALKSGTAYVPLDAQQPEARLAAIVADADPALILAEASHVKAAERLAAGRPVLSIEGDEQACPPLELDDDPEALACVLYAPDAGDLPAGVMHTIQTVLAQALRFAECIGLTPDDRVPMIARCNFGASILDMFGALLSGASLHLIDPYLKPEATFLNDLVRHQVTILHCTPHLLRLLFAQLESGAPAPALRAVVLGGAELRGIDVADTADHFADAELTSVFGPSECSLALWHRAGPQDAEFASVPIGRPVDGIETSLVDVDDRPVGSAGELVLAGEGVALGYWNRPELTDHAFGTRPDGVRYYHTGDLAERRNDGELMFRGRRDQQTKASSYRVAEPAEAEAMLRAHPTVRYAAVVADPDSLPGHRLVGYVTSPGPQAAAPVELLGYLSRMLPAYAIPDRIVVVPTLPADSSGQLDSSRLPAPAEAREGGADMHLTGWISQLTDLWCETLDRGGADRQDHFFASGGDSTRVMRLLRRVKAECGVSISLPVFLAEPTLETLAKLVAASASVPPCGKDRHGGG